MTRTRAYWLAACRQPPYAPEGGDAGARLRDAGRRLWPCPRRPAAGAHLYKYISGTGNWDDYTRLLNRTIAARWRAVCATDCDVFVFFVGSFACRLERRRA